MPEINLINEICGKMKRIIKYTHVVEMYKHFKVVMRRKKSI